MAVIDNHTIQLNISAGTRYQELIAKDRIFPGMLVIEKAGGTGYKHDVPHAQAEKMFAVENPFAGGTIFVPYEIDDNVMLRICRRGDEVLAFIFDHNTPIAYGIPLDSHGDGYLQLSYAINHVGVLAVLNEVDATPVYPRLTRIRIL